jgi:hypothetical protein
VVPICPACAEKIVWHVKIVLTPGHGENRLCCEALLLKKSLLSSKALQKRLEKPNMLGVKNVCKNMLSGHIDSGHKQICALQVSVLRWIRMDNGVDLVCWQDNTFASGDIAGLGWKAFSGMRHTASCLQPSTMLVQCLRMKGEDSQECVSRAFCQGQYSRCRV